MGLFSSNPNRPEPHVPTVRLLATMRTIPADALPRTRSPTSRLTTPPAVAIVGPT